MLAGYFGLLNLIGDPNKIKIDNSEKIGFFSCWVDSIIQ